MLETDLSIQAIFSISHEEKDVGGILCFILLQDIISSKNILKPVLKHLRDTSKFRMHIKC